MKGGNPDKNRFSVFSLSLLFRHFPDSLQNMGFGNQRRQKDATVVCLTCDFSLIVFMSFCSWYHLFQPSPPSQNKNEPK